MHNIYMFHISVLISYDSTLILFHISLDHFLFFPLLVHNFTSIFCFSLSIFATPPLQRARRDVLAFIRSLLSILPYASRLITFKFFPCFLRITRPTFLYFLR
jgi:hypothetical protein